MSVNVSVLKLSTAAHKLIAFNPPSHMIDHNFGVREESSQAICVDTIWLRTDRESRYGMQVRSSKNISSVYNLHTDAMEAEKGMKGNCY